MDGIIIINKPGNITSHDVVWKVRRKLNIKKVGHTGTLDPLATGVLPILIGSGTKISKYLIEHDKTYIATLKLGVKTDTGDITGDVIETVQIPLLKETEIKEVLLNFVGKQKQLPPMYSAIKVNGKKLYEYARNGQQVYVNAREIVIYDIGLIEFTDTEITFEVSCSKGTYIRTLCEDIAKKFNTVGTMSKLKRTKVGKFAIEQSIRLDQLENCNIEENMLSIEEILKDNPILELDNNELTLFLNGVKLEKNVQNGVYNIYNNNIFIGTGIINNNILKRDVVI